MHISSVFEIDISDITAHCFLGRNVWTFILYLRLCPKSRLLAVGIRQTFSACLICLILFGEGVLNARSWQSCLTPMTLSRLSLPLQDRCASLVIISPEPPVFTGTCVLWMQWGFITFISPVLWDYFPSLWSAVCFILLPLASATYSRFSSALSFLFFPLEDFVWPVISSILCIFVEHFLSSVSLCFPSADL